MISGIYAEKMIASRRNLFPDGGFIVPSREAAEGGCGVIGMASNVPLAARHMLQSLMQMRNRGNGKGGGIAASAAASVSSWLHAGSSTRSRLEPARL